MPSKIILTKTQVEQIREAHRRETALLETFRRSISNTTEMLHEGEVNRNYLRESVSRSLVRLSESAPRTAVWNEAVAILENSGVASGLISEGLMDTFRSIIDKAGMSFDALKDAVAKQNVPATVLKAVSPLLLPILMAAGTGDAMGTTELSALSPEQKLEMVINSVPSDSTKAKGMSVMDLRQEYQRQIDTYTKVAGKTGATKLKSARGSDLHNKAVTAKPFDQLGGADSEVIEKIWRSIEQAVDGKSSEKAAAEALTGINSAFPGANIRVGNDGTVTFSHTYKDGDSMVKTPAGVTDTTGQVLAQGTKLQGRTVDLMAGKIIVQPPVDSKQVFVKFSAQVIQPYKVVMSKKGGIPQDAVKIATILRKLGFEDKGNGAWTIPETGVFMDANDAVDLLPYTDARIGSPEEAGYNMQYSKHAQTSLEKNPDEVGRQKAMDKTGQGSQIQFR